MVKMDNLPRAISMLGSGALQFIQPGAFLIRSACSLALFCEGWTTSLLHIAIKGAFAEGLDLLLQAGPLIGKKHFADFLLFRAGVELFNCFFQQTARCFRSLGIPIASRGGFRQESHISTPITHL